MFTSTAATRNCQVAAIYTTLPLSERSQDEYVAWAEEYDTQKKASWDTAAVEVAKRPPASAERASTDNKEVASCARDSTAVDMAAEVFIVDMRCHKTTGTVQHQAVAEHSTALVLPPSGDKASAPTIPPVAPWLPRRSCCHLPPALLLMRLRSFLP